MRADEAPFFQALENIKRAVGQNMPLTREAGDIADFAILTTLIVDRPTKCEFVQNTLFVFRDIQRFVSILWKYRNRPAQHLA